MYSKSMKKRIIYIIPGLGETTRSKNYIEVIKIAEKLGFSVVSVNITWKTDTSMSNFIQQADNQIPNNIQ